MKHRTTAARSRRLPLLVGMLLVMGAAVSAQEPAYQKQTRELAREIMSPFCPGLTMLDCPSPGAAAVRDMIAERFKAGATRDEIVDELYDEYGEVILAAPRARGFGLVAWALPGVFLVIGATFIVVWARRRRAPQTSPEAPELGSEDAQRIESELAKL